ncbi:hypothetical protein DPMN_027360 [Dreissena polymorpha]|uniref:Uncharacterized protein n=1 Tax=Dreissena polymorpha TaxID=45954 RepID=A0A9D4REB2_DREPO|nr:hypothetical protein DPMN_027360 [Dreissena polymorpha]
MCPNDLRHSLGTGLVSYMKEVQYNNGAMLTPVRIPLTLLQGELTPTIQMGYRNGLMSLRFE